MTTIETPEQPTGDQRASTDEVPIGVVSAADVAGPDTASEPSRSGATRDLISTDTLAAGACFLALMALVVAVFAVAIAARSMDEHRAIANAPAGGGAQVTVSLSEFAITPQDIEAPAGSTLLVTNDGAGPHNLAVEGIQTPDLNPGEQATLDISGLAPGTYEVVCMVAGHEAAGMTGTLTIT